MIVFDAVTKRFGNREVFKELTLEIKPGEFLCITGPSGAGKTTFTKLLIGSEEPTEGTISVENRDLAEMDFETLQRYRRNLGIIFQDYKLLSKKTVFENVAFAMEACGYDFDTILKTVPQLLAQVGIAHLQNSFPHELSAGEAQRVALARSLSHEPKIIVADEPTGNLDPDHERSILKLLHELNQRGITVILTTHNRDLAHTFGRNVLQLENGRLHRSV